MKTQHLIICTLLLAMLGGLTLRTAAQPSLNSDNVSPLDKPHNWLDVEQWDKIVEAAKKRGRIIVLLEAADTVTDNDDYNDHHYIYINSAHLQKGGALRVFAYASLGSDAVLKAQAQVEYASPGRLPRIYVLDPNENLLGFISNAQMLKIKPTMDMAQQILGWKARAPRGLKRSFALAKRGNYDRAMNDIDELAQQDIDMTHALENFKRKMSVMYDADNRVVPRREQRRMLREMGELPKPEKGIFLNDVIEQSRQKVRELANEKMQEARQHMEAERYAPAKRMLEDIVEDGTRLGTIHNQAQKLLEEIEAREAEND